MDWKGEWIGNGNQETISANFSSPEIHCFVQRLKILDWSNRKFSGFRKRKLSKLKDFEIQRERKLSKVRLLENVSKIFYMENVCLQFVLSISKNV